MICGCSKTKQTDIYSIDETTFQTIKNSINKSVDITIRTIEYTTSERSEKKSDEKHNAKYAFNNNQVALFYENYKWVDEKTYDKGDLYHMDSILYQKVYNNNENPNYQKGSGEGKTLSSTFKDEVLIMALPNNCSDLVYNYDIKLYFFTNSLGTSALMFKDNVFLGFKSEIVLDEKYITYEVTFTSYGFESITVPQDILDALEN